MMDSKENMTYDYRLYDEIWQRVAPELNPYPEVRSGEMAQASPALPSPAPTNPQVDNLRDLVDEELEGRRIYLAYARCAPNNNARRILRQLAEEEGRHARRLLSLYYLLSGECYKPIASNSCISVPSWCKALRQRYHEETYDALRYEQLSRESEDLILAQTMAEFSKDEQRHARQLLCLLEQNLLA